MVKPKEVQKEEPRTDKTVEIMLGLLVAVSQGQVMREAERKLALARQAEEKARLELLDYLYTNSV